jgi:hypothetical protein
MRALLDQAGSPLEAAYLFKALAAGHPVGAIASFASKIAGKNKKWLRQNLSVADRAGKGKGMKQQFQDTCGPTSVQVLQAEYDPLFALELNQNNPSMGNVDEHNPLANNEHAAMDQLDRYLGSQADEHPGAGVKKGGPVMPAARDGQGGGLPGPELLRMMNDIEKFTKMKFGQPAQVYGNESALLPQLEVRLVGGRMVPLRVAQGTSGGGHLVLAMSFRTRGLFFKKKEIQIFDPWAGASTWVKETDILGRNFQIAGHNMITHAWFQTA